jgi:nitrogen fixation NifU-like protein
MFSPQLLNHFEHPRNSGDVTEPDAEVQLENPACGDILRVSAKVQDGRIAEIRFRAKGCVASIACASAMTELAQGLPVAEARAIAVAQARLMSTERPLCHLRSSWAEANTWGRVHE